MKRDMALILRLLRCLRDKSSGEMREHYPDVKGYDSEVVKYHVGLCIEAGFIDGEKYTSSSDYSRAFRFWGLTWKGHDFLENNRDC